VTTRLVGIDGAGGAGKTTLAARLSDKIVSTDDFIEAPWEWYDFDRLRRDVIDPLKRGVPARYRRMDWNDGTFRRGLERDGEDALPLWAAWSEKEQRYWAAQHPRDAADEIVDGSGG
jgi:uridine kinase